MSITKVEALEENRLSGLVYRSTGAQLFEAKEIYITTDRGFNSKINKDGSITIKGKPNAQYSIAYIESIKLDPGKYFISGGLNLAGYLEAQIAINRNDGTTKYYENKPFEVYDTDKNIIFAIKYNNPILANVDYTLYPMLNTGSLKKPYEPYTGGVPVPVLSAGLSVYNGKFYSLRATERSEANVL